MLFLKRRWTQLATDEDTDTDEDKNTDADTDEDENTDEDTDMDEDTDEDAVTLIWIAFEDPAIDRIHIVVLFKWFFELSWFDWPAVL